MTGNGGCSDGTLKVQSAFKIGAVVKVRLIGGSEAEPKERGKTWTRHRSKQLEELTDFFKQYNRLEDKKFRTIGKCARGDAEALMARGIKRAKN